MAEFNDNYEKGALLMQQALKKYAEGDYEGGDIDREKANKYYDLAKMEANSESGKIAALYGENRNFGIIYKVLESNFSQSINDWSINKQPLLESFKQIRKNKKLNEQFKVFNAFTNPQNVNDANEYVNEVLSLTSKLSQKDLNETNNKLIEFIEKQNINEMIDISDEEMDLFESINFVLTNTKNFNNINEFIEHKNRIINFVEHNNVHSTSNNNIDEQVNENINSLEEKYDLILNEDEKQFISECLSNPLKEEYFNENKQQLISLIEERINSSVNDNREQWVELKNQISESVFNKNTFITDIAKIIEIHNKLSK